MINLVSFMVYENIILGIDVDNTLIFELNHFVSHVNDNIDPSFSYADWSEWDILKVFPEDEDKLIKFMKKYYSRKNIENMHLMDFSSDFLSRFKKENLYYITARSFWLFKNPFEETLELLELNNLPVKKENLVLQKDSLTKMSKCKSLIAKEMGINLFIEDNPENALKISEFCPVLLIDYPFNRNVNHEHIIRIGVFDDEKGDWKKNPWKHALELLDSGEIDSIISSNFCSKQKK